MVRQLRARVVLALGRPVVGRCAARPIPVGKCHKMGHSARRTDTSSPFVWAARADPRPWHADRKQGTSADS